MQHKVITAGALNFKMATSHLINVCEDVIIAGALNFKMAASHLVNVCESDKWNRRFKCKEHKIRC